MRRRRAGRPGPRCSMVASRAPACARARRSSRASARRPSSLAVRSRTTQAGCGVPAGCSSGSVSVACTVGSSQPPCQAACSSPLPSSICADTACGHRRQPGQPALGLREVAHRHARIAAARRGRERADGAHAQAGRLEVGPAAAGTRRRMQVQAGIQPGVGGAHDQLRQRQLLAGPAAPRTERAQLQRSHRSRHRRACAGACTAGGGQLGVEIDGRPLRPDGGPAADRHRRHRAVHRGGIDAAERAFDLPGVVAFPLAAGHDTAAAQLRLELAHEHQPRQAPVAFGAQARRRNAPAVPRARQRVAQVGADLPRAGPARLHLHPAGQDGLRRIAARGRRHSAPSGRRARRRPARRPTASRARSRRRVSRPSRGRPVRCRCSPAARIRPAGRTRSLRRPAREAAGHPAAEPRCGLPAWPAAAWRPWLRGAARRGSGRSRPACCAPARSCAAPLKP